MEGSSSEDEASEILMRVSQEEAEDEEDENVEAITIDPEIPANRVSGIII